MRSPASTMRIGILVAVFCCLGPAGTGETLADVPAARCGPPPASLAQVDLVADSTVILVGAARDPEGRMETEARSSAPDYVELPIRVDQMLKGDPIGAEIVLRAYPRDAAYKPSVASIVQSFGRPAIFHLIHVDIGPTGYYFAGFTPAALTGADPPAIDAVRSEVARQSEVLAGWRPDPTWPHFEAVRGLVAELAAVRPGRGDGLERQAAIFHRIEALGPGAVPAIVAHMDDRRPLAFPQISLVNDYPGAFEGIRHYGPDTIVDALASILNQLTGHGYSQTYNEGSERQRRDEVAGWRIYAMDLVCGHRPPASWPPR